MNSEPAPGTERRALIFNLTLFCITGLALTIYSWVFATHIAHGLESSTLDELVWAATLCSTVFYGTAVYQSYTAYVRRNGPSFSIGPFTILSSSLLPSATTATVPGAIRIYSPMVNASPRSNSNFKFENNSTNAYPDSPSTPRASVELSVCPPTPDTPMSAQSTPMLVTPQTDRSYAPHSPSPAARNKLRFGGMRRSDSFEDDVERGSEMHGLGMGAIGSDVHLVRA